MWYVYVATFYHLPVNNSCLYVNVYIAAGEFVFLVINQRWGIRPEPHIPVSGNKRNFVYVSVAKIYFKWIAYFKERSDATGLGIKDILLIILNWFLNKKIQIKIFYSFYFSVHKSNLIFSWINYKIKRVQLHNFIYNKIFLP